MTNTASWDWDRDVSGMLEDTGCERGGPSCLNCKLPLCIHDQPSQLVHQSYYERDEKIWELAKRGIPNRDIHKAMGVSYRQINRIIKRGGASQAAKRLQATLDAAGRLDSGIKKSPLNSKPIIKARRPLPPLPVGRVS